MAELELAVHPAERRRGIGTQLLDAVVEAARQHEVQTVLADATVGTAADHFLAAKGFAVGLTLHFTRLALADVDDAVLASIADKEHPGYRLESWRGVVSDELVQTFTDARSAMDDAPVGDIDFGPEEWDVDRTRSVAQVVEDRGEHLGTVAAIDETGQIVGFTELVVGGDGTGDGQHYGTAVLPEHRGHGLARWMKAEAIRQAREDFPELAGLLTDMVDTNVAMRHINDELGYRTTHLTRRYTLKLS